VTDEQGRSVAAHGSGAAWRQSPAGAGSLQPLPAGRSVAHRAVTFGMAADAGSDVALGFPGVMAGLACRGSPSRGMERTAPEDWLRHGYPRALVALDAEALLAMTGGAARIVLAGRMGCMEIQSFGCTLRGLILRREIRCSSLLVQSRRKCCHRRRFRLCRSTKSGVLGVVEQARGLRSPLANTVFIRPRGLRGDRCCRRFGLPLDARHVCGSRSTTFMRGTGRASRARLLDEPWHLAQRCCGATWTL